MDIGGPAPLVGSLVKDEVQPMKRPVRKASALRLFGGMAAIGVAASALSGCEQPGVAVPVAPTETAITNGNRATNPGYSYLFSRHPLHILDDLLFWCIDYEQLNNTVH